MYLPIDRLGVYVIVKCPHCKEEIDIPENGSESRSMKRKVSRVAIASLIFSIISIEILSPIIVLSFVKIQVDLFLMKSAIQAGLTFAYLGVVLGILDSLPRGLRHDFRLFRAALSLRIVRRFFGLFLSGSRRFLSRLCRKSAISARHGFDHRAISGTFISFSFCSRYFRREVSPRKIFSGDGQ